MLRLTRLIGAGYLLVCVAALLATALLGPAGYAPLPLPIGPGQQPVVVTIWYGTEKRAWLEEAAASFAASNPRAGGRPIQIVLRGMGSGEQVDRVARQDFGANGRPTAVSPASTMWVQALEERWRAANPAERPVVAGGAQAPAPLALTPLVLVSWEERGPLIWPDPQGDFWGQLHAALAQPNWSALGGREAWGPVKLGHTSPLSSNSGAQALALLAYGFHGRASGLTPADVQSPAFRTWLSTVEAAVPAFPDSSGELMTSMLQRGPSQYDVAVVYESQAIESMESARSWGGMRVYYPPATAMSDHPFAILDAPWTTPAEREAARQFRDFLLSRPAQESARAFGFRPADPAVPVGDGGAADPFVRYSGSGLRAEITQQAEPLAPATLDALLRLWQAVRGG